MPNETLKEERARLKRETKALGKNLKGARKTPQTKEKPVLLETMFGEVTEEEFDRKSKAFEKNMRKASTVDKIKAFKGEDFVKKKEMNMGRQATGRRGNPPPSRRMMQTPRMPVPQAISTQASQPMSPSLNAQMQGSSMGQSLPDATPPPGMREGGKAGKPRGYGIARGGKACKMS
tara:strand:- start:45 stop:572 length:528 start_codon:yes stop_codon:yes gene_type:complete